MQNKDIDGTLSYVSFQKLGGKPVPIDHVIDEIRKLPLDGILGFLASLSIESIQAEGDFFNPRRQGFYLNLAIVDDFPSPLPKADYMYSPGHVPFTRGRHVFIHEHNIAWLSHQALIYAKDIQNTDIIEYKLKVRICRLLLISNDFLTESKTEVPATLTQRRSFVSLWIRLGQFNTFQNQWEPGVELARQYIIMKELLPKYFPVENEFAKATNGITLECFFQVLAILISHIYHIMSSQKQWLRRSTFCKDVEEKKEEIEYVLSSWIRTPEEYRKGAEKWRAIRKNKDDRSVFDYIPLRKTPLIEARPNELICPVINFLLEKIFDGPFFIITEYLKDKNFGDFHKGLGKSYEDYAHNLIKKIAKNDMKGRWYCWKTPPIKKGTELTDTYLQRGRIGILFEHKGGRLPTDFRLGAEDERVLGPQIDVLQRLDTGDTVEAKKILRNDQDEGIITRAMWQQSLHMENLQKWASKQLGRNPEKIFPIITHHADIRIDEVCRAGYLEPLIKAANLYSNNFIELPQWLHVSDLEALESLAEEGKLDIESLLVEKAKSQNRIKRFDLFIYDKFQDRRLLLNKTLKEKFIDILRAAGKTFWPTQSFD